MFARVLLHVSRRQAFYCYRLVLRCDHVQFIDTIINFLDYYWIGSIEVFVSTNRTDMVRREFAIVMQLLLKIVFIDLADCRYDINEFIK